MDDGLQKYLESEGFDAKVFAELSKMGVKSFDDLGKMSSEELVSRTSLKPLQAKELIDMIKNPMHPKSPRASSSKISRSGFDKEDPCPAYDGCVGRAAASQVQRENDMLAWLESINPRYGQYAAAFEDEGVDLEEIDDGLSEGVLSSVQSALSKHGAKTAQIDKIMSNLRSRTGTNRGQQTGGVSFALPDAPPPLLPLPPSWKCRKT